MLSFSISLSFPILVLHSILFLPSSTSLFFLFYFPSPSLFSHFPTSLHLSSFFLPPRHSSLYLLSTSSSSMYTILRSLPPFVSSLFLFYLTLFPSSLLRLYSSQIFSPFSSLFPPSLFPLHRHIILFLSSSPSPLIITPSSFSLIALFPSHCRLSSSPYFLFTISSPLGSLHHLSTSFSSHAGLFSSSSFLSSLFPLPPTVSAILSLSRFTWSLFFPSCQPLIPSSSLPPISPLPTLPFLPSFSHQIFTSFFFP